MGLHHFAPCNQESIEYKEILEGDTKILHQ